MPLCCSTSTSAHTIRQFFLSRFFLLLFPHVYATKSPYIRPTIRYKPCRAVPSSQSSIYLCSFPSYTTFSSHFPSLTQTRLLVLPHDSRFSIRHAIIFCCSMKIILFFSLFSTSQILCEGRNCVKICRNEIMRNGLKEKPKMMSSQWKTENDILLANIRQMNVKCVSLQNNIEENAMANKFSQFSLTLATRLGLLIAISIPFSWVLLTHILLKWIILHTILIETN